MRVGKRAKDIGWKEFFAFYWKSTFCSTAGAVGSFPTFRLFCQHRCSGKRAICLTLAYAPCQQFSTLHIFIHYSARFHVFGATKSTIFLSNILLFAALSVTIILAHRCAVVDDVRQKDDCVLGRKPPAAFDGSKKLCGRFPQSFRVYWRMRDYPSVLASIFSIATISGLLKILSSTSELSPACCACSSTALSCGSGMICTPFPP